MIILQIPSTLQLDLLNVTRTQKLPYGLQQRWLLGMRMNKTVSLQHDMFEDDRCSYYGVVVSARRHQFSWGYKLLQLVLLALLGLLIAFIAHKWITKSPRWNNNTYVWPCTKRHSHWSSMLLELTGSPGLAHWSEIKFKLAARTLEAWLAFNKI